MIVVVLTQMAALTGLRPLISYRAIDLGATTAEIGVVAAAYAAFSFLLAIPVGRRVDRTSEAPFIVGGAVVIAAATVVTPYVDTIVGLGVVQAFLGIGQLAGIMGVQALVASTGEASTRDARFGVFSATASVGQMAGPSLAGWLVGGTGGTSSTAFAAMAVVAVLSVVGSLPLWLWSPRGGRPATASPARTSPTPVLPMLRLPGMRTAMWASLTALASIDILIAYLPAYGERYGIPAATIGLLLAMRAAGSTVIRVAMLPLLRLMGPRRLLSASLALTAASLGALPPAASSPGWVLVVLLLLAGMGLGLGQPITMSWVATRAPDHQRATALGVRITGNRVGQLVLPAAVGLAAGPAGVPVVLVALGVVLASSAAFVARSVLDTSSEGRAPAVS